MGYMFLASSSHVLRGARRWAGVVASLAVLAILSRGQESSNPPDTSTASELFKRVISNQKKSEALLDEYERTQHIEKKTAGTDSDPTTTCYRLFPAGPAITKVLLAPDGKPPHSDGYRYDLEKLEKYLAWAAADGASQKDAYAKAQRKRKERFDLMDATHQAFVFTLEGKEMRGDRTLLRYSMTPNPAYKPTSRNTGIFTRVRGTIWIDEQSSEMAKIEGSVTEDFSVALFLAKVYKGSEFMQERYEVAPGIWEPTFEQYDFDGRKFMVPFSIHERTWYTDYQHVGPPKESIAVIRAELSKLQADPSSH
jgi:hypothetical protein